MPATCPQCGQCAAASFQGLGIFLNASFIFSPTDLSICLLRSPGRPTVAVNLNCQPDEIYNHHGNKPWGLSVRLAEVGIPTLNVNGTTCGLRAQVEGKGDSELSISSQPAS